MMRKINPKTYSLIKAEKELEKINQRIVKNTEQIMTLKKLTEKSEETICQVIARKIYIKSILTQKKKFVKRYTKIREIDRLLKQ